ncbi:Uncharacterised protein [BD1-7 clade bacterium]|uniref:Cytochrome c domain-containing protein n=1 Tax=BD1-7 clade bacterium TaxID=2029982 RepID=A0A5S9QXZ0_9GAMM|nr:Uncharacterised protein [BD1-7 clade bacterium]
MTAQSAHRALLLALIACLTIALLAIHPAQAQSLKASDKTTLVLSYGDKTETLTLKQLKTSLRTIRVPFFSPVYDQEVAFHAFRFTDIAGLIKADLTKVTHIDFIASDGYRATLDASLLEKYPHAWLGYEQINPKHGAPFDEVVIDRESLQPQPFYLFWQDPITYKAFPWPFSVTEILFSTSSNPYSEIAPSPNAAEQVKAGFDIFTQQCVVCHSMNLVGGTIGPEMNIPQNFTEYLPMEFLRAYILNPTSFRARNRMSEIHLTPHQADKVLSYIRYMRKHKALDKLKAR